MTMKFLGGIMVQEIEIEYKTLLTKQEFTTLLHALSFPQDSVSQTNYYFDTINFALKEHQVLYVSVKKQENIH